MYICQWIMNLAKWRQVNMFQYSCLNPLIPPEGICIWILASCFFIHPNTYFSSREIFKPLQYQNDKLVSCHAVTNSMKILKNHEKSCSKIACSSS